MNAFIKNPYYESKIRSEKANIAHYKNQIRHLENQIEHLKEKGKPTRSLEDAINTLNRNMEHSNMMISRYQRLNI